MKQHILFGISAGIAIVKIPELVQSLSRSLNVHVIMTQHAALMVKPDIFEKNSGNTVYTDMFNGTTDVNEIRMKRSVTHINLATQAAVFVIAPATANIIAKLAHGIADDYLTTTALAVTCPVLLFPSMNVHMWNNSITQQNIVALLRRGIHVFRPDSGMLACGINGTGRLPDTKLLYKEIIRLAHRSDDLKGLRVLVTAGGSYEPIDDVRVITNRSTGKMGNAIAKEAYLRGARVTILRSSTSIPPHFGLTQYLFHTAEDLTKLIETHLPKADICIHTAAISDFTVKQKKRGKTPSDRSLPLELTPKTKILDTIKRINPRVVLIAFKAEFDVSRKELIYRAKNRLKISKADLIVANDIGKSDNGFASDFSEVYIIDSDGVTKHVKKAPKAHIAVSIIDSVINALRSRG